MPLSSDVMQTLDVYKRQILNNEIYHGRAGRAGAFGHITLNPSGRKCFCGACGCWSAYNALNALTGLDETDLDGFFEKVNNEDPDAIAKWDEYLTYFADGLSTVSMSFDIDIVIGGPLAVYLAVSYTHLDVYKRQLLRAMASCTI